MLGDRSGAAFKTKPTIKNPILSTNDQARPVVRELVHHMSKKQNLTRKKCLFLWPPADLGANPSSIQGIIFVFPKRTVNT